MNLVKKSECTCECHKEGVIIMHVQPCCYSDSFVEKQNKNEIKKINDKDN